MNNYDRTVIKDIMLGHGDWYGAMLLRTIALGNSMERRLFYISYPEEMQAVDNLDLKPPEHQLGMSDVFNSALDRLFAKADLANKRKLARCFSRLESRLLFEISHYR